MGRVLVLVLVGAALATAAIVTAGRYLSVSDVRLPDVRGLGYRVASEQLRERGLRVLTYPELDAAAPADTVVSQTPPSGSVVRLGRTVSLGVNALAEVQTMPTLVGLPERDAIERAEHVGLVVERVVYVRSERPAGMVVQQWPEPGGGLAGDAGVTLDVSRGQGERSVELPDVRGLTLEEAKAALQGLGVRRVDAVAAGLSFDRPNTVTEQRPPAGTEVLSSTPVTLVYALEGTRVVRVPDVAGAPLWQAQVALRAAQLALGPVRVVDDPARPAGVLEVRPSGYTVVGSPVALVVNGPVRATSEPRHELEDLGFPTLGGVDVGGDPTAPAEPDVPAPGTTALQADGSRLIPFRFDPATVGVASLTREAYRLTLVVNDDDGERTVLDRDLEAGESVVTSVRVVGDEPMLQTFINGSFFQAWRP